MCEVHIMYKGVRVWFQSVPETVNVDTKGLAITKELHAQKRFKSLKGLCEYIAGN